jgi:hypothetical protein
LVSSGALRPMLRSRSARRQRLQPLLHAILLTFVAVAVCGCHNTVTDLAAAQVPVQSLAHLTGDPAARYPEKFPMQVAVYWAKPEESTLEAEHSLGEMGIPFFITRDLGQALRHRLVMLYPSVDGRTFSDAQLGQITRFVQNGGSLLATNVFAGGLKPVFGFSDYVPSQQRHKVDFMAGADPALRYLNRPQELETRLGDPQFANIFWTNGYAIDPSATVLAKFEDGSAAVIRKNFGKGSAYLLGLALQDVVLRNQNDHDYEAQRHYVNTFEPGADVWLLLLRAWYESRQPGAVRVATIPSGKDSVLLLSHDIDWENSFAPALQFAKMEKEHNALSTFFIQTKYVSDYNSKSFFYGKDLEYLRELYSEGFSIGSHSVIHSRGFNKFDLGSGTETYATYRPSGTGFDSATGATVFGEVRVTKELLNGELPGQQTVFFRAGHLRVPESLPEALQRTGYEFDSSFTANDLLTDFPFSLPLGLGFAEDSGLYEFPVTFEDEEQPPLLQRVDSALDVIRANAENGGINVLLIHPNVAGDKLAAEKEMLEKLPADVSATDMQSYALFWRGRDQMRWDVQAGKTDKDATLTVTASDSVAGLTFEFQRGISSADGAVGVTPDCKRIVLPDLKAGQKLTVHVRYAK